jgi:CheY-like chemotaxis protein
LHERLTGEPGEEGRMLRILVVDDEPEVREAISLLLKQEGHRVVVAEGGHGALSAVEAFTFDLVIVDIFMPGMGGLETLDVLREDAPDLPIIVMSGYVDGSGAVGPDFFRAAVERGATCCLRKPFIREQLIDAVAFCHPSSSMVA